MLETDVSPQSIEQAHRPGHYYPNKDRPIINFSVNVCYGRKRHLEYVKVQDDAFRLHFNKLVIGNKSFCYNRDKETETVKCLRSLTTHPRNKSCE